MPPGPDPPDAVRRHLEGAGYVVHLPRPQEPNLLLARHPERPTLAVKALPGATRFNTSFVITDGSLDRLALLEAVNEFNRTAIGVCACVNGRGELSVEGWLFAPYDRVTFNGFLRRVWEHELQRLARDARLGCLEPHEPPPAGHERP